VLVPKLIEASPDNSEPAMTGLQRLIMEVNRVNPSLGVLYRRCEIDTHINGIPIRAGQYVGALTSAAGFDSNEFPDPKSFSLAPYLPGKERPLDKYLMFGAPYGARASRCWGKEKIAMTCLEEMLIAASKLQGLKPVAGRAGNPTELLGAVIGLSARFPAFPISELPDAGV